MEKQYIFIPKKNRFEKVMLDDILWVKASGSSVLINVKNLKVGKDRYVHSANLKNFIQQVPAPHLIRIHRSFLVNLHAVEAIDGRRLIVEGEKIPFSERYRQVVEMNFPKLRTC